MKLSNFRNYESKPKSYYATSKVELADVDVTTGFLFWKKVETRQICCDNSSYWFFVDNGVWTPNHQAENLAKSYKIQHNIF